ncbi:MAG: DUF3604 domain-containing protein, partial [Armatimonadetes bacterium]|nr:DUF3604 domain-containing protein [Armatimonadota bacterium]
FVAIARADGTAIPPSGMPQAGLVAFTAPAGGLRRGEVLRVDLGGRAGTVPPRLDLLSKMVLLLVPVPADPDVPAINAEPGRRVIGAFLLHITGGPLEALRVHAPSHATPGVPFSVLVRGEDAHRNLACQRPGELTVSVNGATLEGLDRRDLEHGAGVWLSGVVFDAEGVLRLEVRDATHGLTAVSNPVRCAADEGAKHYWGMIHGHTEQSDGAGTLDHYFTYMRDACGLDFGALGDHDHVFETTDEMWARAQTATARYHEPERFVTFLGYEWAKWRQNGDGDRNVYYREDHRPMYRSDNGHCATPPELYAALADETAIIITHHSANIGNHCDWKDYDPGKDRLVEIFSEWGSSECSLHDGNPYPIRPATARPAVPDSGEVAAGFVQRALALGWRVGFTAGGDDHQGHPGDVTLRGSNPERAPGLLAVRAPANTREALWESLYGRNCYGTTGARIILDFDLDGAPMGSELWLSERPELAERRTVRVEAHGTDAIARIEIIRNNQTIHVHEGTGLDEECVWEDDEPFADVALPPGPHWPTPFCCYYVRLTQADGEMAWASPIWVSPKVSG